MEIETRGRKKFFDKNNPEHITRFADLASVGATYEEIAWAFGCCERTVYAELQESENEDENFFLRLYNEHKGTFHKSVRRKQLERAIEGDTGMLVWLGKTVLKQKEESTLNLNSRRSVLEAMENGK